MRAYCFPASGCREASPQASVRLAFISLNFSTNSPEVEILASAFKN